MLPFFVQTYRFVCSPKHCRPVKLIAVGSWKVARNFYVLTHPLSPYTYLSTPTQHIGFYFWLLFSFSRHIALRCLLKCSQFSAVLCTAYAFILTHLHSCLMSLSICRATSTAFCHIFLLYFRRCLKMYSCMYICVVLCVLFGVIENRIY